MKKVIAVVGPTGVGKSNLGIDIAEKFNGEIISGDSMQIYTGMDIGTAKVTEKEKKGIPHHMIDIKNPGDFFSAADFQSTVEKKINEILSRQKLPILVGGTGLYIQSVIYGYKFPAIKRDEEVQKRLEVQLNQYGAGYLWEQLNKLDPETAEKIHPNNHRRLIRALEVLEANTSNPISVDQNPPSIPEFDPIVIGLEMDRTLLYERINQRVDRMMEDGLLEEVRQLYEKGLEGSQALQAIGYKEFIPYFKNKQTLDEAVALLKRNSRRYAKRQYTWFRNKMNVNWYTVTPDSMKEERIFILEDLAGMLEER